jgi:hypothetical protein
MHPMTHAHHGVGFLLVVIGLAIITFTLAPRRHSAQRGQ